MAWIEPRLAVPEQSCISLGGLHNSDVDECCGSGVPTCALTPLRSLRLPALSSLSPSSSVHSPFRKSAQAPLAAGAPPSSLCSLSSLVLLSAPGLHYSDLSLLPTSSSLHALSSAIEPSNQVAYPYADARSKAAKGGPVDRFVERFVAECGATIERGAASGEKNVWAGEDAREEKKKVRVQVVKGLEEWELTGRVAREGRKEVVQRIGTSRARFATGRAMPLSS